MEPALKIGKFRVVHTATALVSSGDDMVVSFVFDDAQAQVTLRFEDSPLPGSTIRVEPPVPTLPAVITFLNWNGSLAATSSPAFFAKSRGGAQLYFSAVCWTFGKAIRLVFAQFLTEAGK